MKWTHSKRKALQRGLQSGMTITALAEELSVSRPTILEEIKRGVTSECYAAKDYKGYSVGDAILNYMIEKTGDSEPGIAIAEMLHAYERRKDETKDS